MNKDLLIQAAIFTGIVSASIWVVGHSAGEASNKRLQEAIGNVALLESKTPSKTWRVKPGSVHDGDTFRAVADVTGEEIRVRLSCIDAPEIKQAGGIESRDFLRGMLPDNAEVILVIAETDRFGRSVAEVYAPIRNSREEIAVNGEMVKAGMAHYYERYNKACPDNAEMYDFWQETAISQKVGVWSGDAERPWDFRRRNK